jgi:hypothetical protein
MTSASDCAQALEVPQFDGMAARNEDEARWPVGAGDLDRGDSNAFRRSP